MYICLQISKYFKRRKNFYKEYFNFLQTLLSEISFLKTDLVSIINRQIENNNSTDFTKTLKVFQDYISKDNNSQLAINSSILSKEENQELTNFFSSIGKKSLLDEIENIKHTTTLIEQKSNQVSEYFSKYSPISIKSGILISLLVIIIFI